jgi:outer membrane receptor protein involved in Fe transport
MFPDETDMAKDKNVHGIQRGMLFAQDSFQAMDKLKLVGGVQFNRESNVQDRFTPRASIIYQPSSNSALEANYSDGFRGPTAGEEANAKGTNLKPQSMDMLELSYNQAFQAAGMKGTNLATAYKMQSHNTLRTGASGAATLNTTQTSAKDKAYGIEDQVKISALDDRMGWFFGGRYIDRSKTRTSVACVTPEKFLANLPVTKVNGGASYKWFTHLETALFANYWSKVRTEVEAFNPSLLYTVNAPGATTPPTVIHTIPSRATVDLNVNVGEFKSDKATLGFAFYVENLLNATYYDPAWGKTAIVQYIQPPRNYRGSVTLKF